MTEFALDRGALLAGTVAVLALERVVELLVSHRNLMRLRLEGTAHAASSGGGEYATMVLVHVLFLVCPLLEFRLRGQRGPELTALIAVGAIVAAQILRWWTIRTLGPRWNARAVVAPALGAVHGGPYRFLRHPNYLAVSIEFAALPFVGGSLWSGTLIFLANLVVLARRKRQEERLLEQIPGWRAGFER